MSMQQSSILKAILGLAALLLLIAGAFSLFNPIGFTARNGVDIAGEISALNDYRAAGGVMLGSAIVILLGIIHSRMTFTSTVVAIMAHLAIAAGRLLSFIADGTPAKGLVAAMIVEFVVAGLAIFALVKFREKSSTHYFESEVV